MSDKGRLVTKRKLGKIICQIKPAEKYVPEEEVTLYEIVVEAADIVVVMLSNLANKTAKIMKGENVRKGSSNTIHKAGKI